MNLPLVHEKHDLWEASMICERQDQIVLTHFGRMDNGPS